MARRADRRWHGFGAEVAHPRNAKDRAAAYEKPIPRNRNSSAGAAQIDLIRRLCEEVGEPFHREEYEGVSRRQAMSTIRRLRRQRDEARE